MLLFRSVSLMRLLVFLLISLLHLCHAHPTALRQDASRTLYDLISATSRPAQFDDNGKDMDILVTLIARTQFQTVLMDNTDDGITFLAPNDDAFRQSAIDLGFNPNNERQTYSFFEQLFNNMFQDDLVNGLTGVLQYHTGIVETTSDRIGADQPFVTLTGEQISLLSNALADGAPDIPDPAIVLSFADVRASNGILHTIDRLLFREPVPPELLQDPSDDAPTNPPVQLPTTSPTPVITPPQDAADDGFDPALDPDTSTEAIDPTPTPTTITSTESPTTAPESAATPAPQSPSPSPDTSDEPACFPASARVRLADGSDLRLSDLAAGHHVHVSQRHTSPIYLFTHRTRHGLHRFVQITTASDHVVTLSDGHYLYANNRLTTARSVRVGDVLQTLRGNSRVTKVQTVMQRGLIAPHTLHGDIVVNGVVVSTYTSHVHPRLAHVLLAPIRTLVRLGVVEPLGAMFYNGDERFAWRLPSGADVY